MSVCVHGKLLQSCLTITIYNPMFCSPPGSPVHGILQARILEWVAMSSSRGSSQPRDQTLRSPSLLWLLHCRQILYPITQPLGKPESSIYYTKEWQPSTDFKSGSDLAILERPSVG